MFLGGFSVIRLLVHFRLKRRSTCEQENEDHGSFFAFVPQQIQADWHEKYGPLLEGFPLDILYGGITSDARTKKKSIVDVC